MIENVTKYNNNYTINGLLYKYNIICRYNNIM